MKGLNNDYVKTVYIRVYIYIYVYVQRYAINVEYFC